MAGLTLARLAVLEFAVLISAAAGADSVPSLLRLPASERPVRVVDQLLVNSSNKERFVTLARCEPDGIARIRELMIHSSAEELWAFLPDSDGSAGCLWIEIGGEVRSESDLASVEVDWPYLSELIARFSDIRVYHFHPLSYFERCGNGQGCNEFAVPLSTDGISAEGVVNNLRYAMPSPGDIYFMMETSWRFERAHRHTAAIRHRVVSPYGVVEYALTPSGKTKYAENRSTRMEGLYIKMIAANALSDESISVLVAAFPNELGKAVEKLGENMNSRFLRVELLP